jgi:16S rRNA (guanine966-N2)-methyltransferase
MSIKILGGLAKSRSLFVPNGQLIRPTSVLLKRRIFDSIQDLSGYEFYDLCAGSGAMGLEAWSRGASKCFMLEKNRIVFNLLKKNISTMQEHYRSEYEHRPIKAVNGNMEKWLAAPQECISKEEAILFVDPPYEIHKLYKVDTLKLLNDPNRKAQVWIESDKDKGVPLEFWIEQGLNPFKVFKQGSSYIALFDEL